MGRKSLGKKWERRKSGEGLRPLGKLENGNVGKREKMGKKRRKSGVGKVGGDEEVGEEMGCENEVGETMGKTWSREGKCQERGKWGKKNVRKRETEEKLGEELKKKKATEQWGNFPSLEDFVL